MDASRKIQRGIHVHLIQFLMCPESWVHITVDTYINYYNNERIQAKTKWMPPAKFREASMCT